MTALYFKAPGLLMIRNEKEIEVDEREGCPVDSYG